MTRRGWTLAAVAVGLWGLARLLGVREYMMVALAAAALLAIAALASGFSSTRLDLRRRVRPAVVPFGGTAVVELELLNTGRLPTPFLRVVDRAPSLLAPTTHGEAPPIRPGGRRTVAYRLEGVHRGAWTLGPALVELTDPFGLVRRARVLDVTGEAVVLPRVVRLPGGLPLGGRVTGGGVGRPRPLPAGEELANVREYVRGDDLRRVHWRTTAHRGKLMIRQDEAPQQAQAVLVLDTLASAHTVGGPTSTFERAVSLAASVAADLDDRGKQVRLALTDADLGGAAPDAAGLLRRLARVEPSEIGARRLWVALEQGVEDQEALITVVGVPDAEALRLMVRGARRFAVRVAVVVTDAATAPRAEAAATSLRAAGWRAVALAPSTPMDIGWRDLVAQRGPARAAAT